jgi:arylsulfatase
VRDGVLTAVETITTLDADFWREFSDPGAPDRLVSGDLRPDWSKRGFLRGYTDARYSFGRYFSPLEPNRPTDVESLLAQNDVVLYDRETDPDELVNLALDPSQRELVGECSRRLEALITDEVGEDRRVWVLERPHLLGWPTWRGDRAA